MMSSSAAQRAPEPEGWAQVELWVHLCSGRRLCSCWTSARGSPSVSPRQRPEGHQRSKVHGSDVMVSRRTLTPPEASVFPPHVLPCDRCSGSIWKNGTMKVNIPLEFPVITRGRARKSMKAASTPGRKFTSLKDDLPTWTQVLDAGLDLCPCPHIWTQLEEGQAGV